MFSRCGRGQLSSRVYTGPTPGIHISQGPFPTASHHSFSKTEKKPVREVDQIAEWNAKKVIKKQHWKAPCRRPHALWSGHNFQGPAHKQWGGIHFWMFQSSEGLHRKDGVFSVGLRLLLSSETWTHTTEPSTLENQSAEILLTPVLSCEESLAPNPYLGR